MARTAVTIVFTPVGTSPARIIPTPVAIAAMPPQKVFVLIIFLSSFVFLRAPLRKAGGPFHEKFAAGVLPKASNFEIAVHKGFCLRGRIIVQYTIGKRSVGRRTRRGRAYGSDYGSKVRNLYGVCGAVHLDGPGSRRRVLRTYLSLESSGRVRKRVLEEITASVLLDHDITAHLKRVITDRDAIPSECFLCGHGVSLVGARGFELGADA